MSVSTPALVALLALIASVLGSVVTYLVAVRRLSGKVKTTEAEDLWREAGALRKEYLDAAEDLRSQLRDCRERIAVIEMDNERLHTENHRLQKRVEELTRENERLRLEIAQLRGEVRA
jgi:predicted RNase H-like nuclease (RuvC/YqgF family)